jgi:hypothetical protein
VAGKDEIYDAKPVDRVPRELSSSLTEIAPLNDGGEK